MNRITDPGKLFFPLALLILFNIRLTAFGAFNHIHISSNEFFSILGAQTAVFCCIAVILRLLLSSWGRAVYALCYIVFLWVFGSFLSTIILGRDLFSIIAVIYVVILCFYGIHHLYKRHGRAFRLVLSVFALVMFCMQIVGLVEIASAGDKVSVFHDAEDITRGKRPENLPHIVYVIPDRYANNTVLKELYGFDNASFTQSLRDRKFHVWDNQYSNYPKTFLSIASTQNMNYLNDYTSSLEKDTKSYLPVYRLIQDNQAQRALRDAGYRYTNVCSGWGPTSLNVYADANFYGPGFDLTETKRKYLETTPFHFLLYLRFDENECKVEEEKIKFIKQTLKSDKPQFVFWHSLITHDPYIYSSDGSCRNRDEERRFISDWPGRKKNYTEHIQHFNGVTLDLFDEIIQESSRPIIFVIQADEGEFPYNYLNEETLGKYDFLNAKPEEMRRKHAVFNAIYFPDQDYRRFEEQKTPINNFRLILNKIFGVEIPLLDHKAYTFTHDDDPYQFEDISDKILSGD